MNTQQLTPQDLLQFNELCQTICAAQNFDQKKKSEAQITEFLQNFENFPKIKSIIMETDNNVTIFVICELLQQQIQKTDNFKQGFTNYTQTLQNYYLTPPNQAQPPSNPNPQLLILDCFFNLFIEYLSQKLSKSLVQIPGFLSNSVTHLVSQLIKQFCREEDGFAHKYIVLIQQTFF